ncbi:MAG: hypothetical protein IT452_02810 [Planctomycetia bacterium]|nr:hypothetical protein [Planctomycetia bacterium]
MPADPRERRTVTVLFSDLSGFTRLSASLDPEEAADLVDALFLRLRGVIEAHGGTVDKFIGDAVMAVFGAPVARGDDAARAVRAALAMQREVGAFARENGRDLRLRVGLNTGEVLWGGIGGDRATAMGDAVNVAQRMEAAAEPGTVVLAELGRPGESVAMPARARDLNLEIGQRWNAGIAWVSLVWALSAADRPADAEREATEAIARLEGTAGAGGDAELHAERALARLNAGLPGAEEDVAAARESARERTGYAVATVPLAAARLDLARGRPEAARAALDEIRGVFPNGTPWNWSMEILDLEARILLASGDAAGAARVAEEGARLAAQAGGAMRERRFRALLERARP